MALRIDTTPVGPVPSLVPSRAEARRHIAVAPGLEPAFVASGDGQRNLDRLLSRDALCITTGQQPGLLTGPIYTIYKAISAIALAQRSEEELGRPVVPVFWVAGDDHDFAEANHIRISNSTGSVETITLRERDPAGTLIPLYQEPVGEEIAAVFASVREHTPESEFRKGVLARLERAYHPTTNLASAFADALAELFGPAGLVVFRSTHPAAKRAVAPILLRALEQAGALDEALGERARYLADQGHDTPVPVGEGAAPVMLEGALGRDRLTLGGPGFVTRRSSEPWTIEQVRQVAEREPERLSPNVLLRPVVEAAILPTLAYVGGPSELAYQPQSEPLYRALGVEPQSYVSRWAGRIVESRVDKVLRKFDISADALEAPPGKVESQLVAEDLPASARAALDALRSALTAEYGRLETAAQEVDPTLRRTVESARGAALTGTTNVEKRLLAHLKKRNAVALSQIQRARTELFPLGQPQERVFSIVPYLIRYGDDFLSAILEEARRWMGTLEPVTSPP